MRLATRLTSVVRTPGEPVLDLARAEVAKAEAGGSHVLRWGIVASDDRTFTLELATAEDAGPARQVARSVDPAGGTPGTHVAMVVPTGVGAEVGGFIGDAGPWSRVLESVADTVIVHPNVVNAADFYTGGDRSLYVDGLTLDEFFAGRVRLASRPRPPRVGVVLDQLPPPLHRRLVNAVNAMRTVGGVDIVAYAACPEKVRVRTERSAVGHFVGTVDNPEGLFAAVESVVGAGAEVIAVVSAITGAGSEAVFAHYDGHGPNPVGAIEALISRAVTWQTGLPCAHAPAFVEGVGQRDEIIDPRAAAEVASGTGLPCVLQGLRFTPSVAAGIGVADLTAVIVPFSCAGGAPAIAAADFGVPLVAVRGNATTVGIGADALGLPSTVVVESYAEAVAYVAAQRAGVSWAALSRPTDLVIEF